MTRVSERCELLPNNHRITTDALPENTGKSRRCYQIAGRNTQQHAAEQACKVADRVLREAREKAEQEAKQICSDAPKGAESEATGIRDVAHKEAKQVHSKAQTGAEDEAKASLRKR